MLPVSQSGSEPSLLEPAGLRPPISNAVTSHSENPEPPDATEAPLTDRALGERTNGLDLLAGVPERRGFFTQDVMRGSTISLICEVATMQVQ